MVQAYRVVDRLAEPFDDRNLTPGVNGGAEDDFLEEIDGNMLRAGKREKDPAGIKVPEGVQIEKFISARGGIHVASLVRQGRRIEDDQIELSVDFL
jgi:hypothetical protein